MDTHLNTIDTPFFSVITATYNRPDMLNRALSSLVTQSFTNFEVIIIDDASDQKPDLSPWQDKLNIKYLRNEKNVGVSASRNKAIQQSQGKWVIFLDDDDEYFPDILKKHHDFLSDKDESKTFCWSGVEAVVESEDKPPVVEQHLPLEEYPNEDEAVFHTLRIGTGFGLTVARNTILAVGLFDTSLRRGEDIDLMLKLMAYGAKPYPLHNTGVRIYFHQGASLSNDTRTLIEHNIQARLIARHHPVLRQYPKSWMHYCVGTMHLLLHYAAFKAAWRLLVILLKIRDPNIKVCWNLLLLIKHIPAAIIRRLKSAEEKYNSLPLEEEIA